MSFRQVACNQYVAGSRLRTSHRRWRHVQTQRDAYIHLHVHIQLQGQSQPDVYIQIYIYTHPSLWAHLATRPTRCEYTPICTHLAAKPNPTKSKAKPNQSCKSKSGQICVYSCMYTCGYKAKSMQMYRCSYMHPSGCKANPCTSGYKADPSQMYMYSCMFTFGHEAKSTQM